MFPSSSAVPIQSVVQNVQPSKLNNSTVNLAALAVFLGGAESTLNVSGIQFIFAADQFCTVVVEQAVDGSFTTGTYITDSFNADPSVGNIGYTVQAVGAYFRIRVTNTSLTTATTTLTLSTVLCPIVETLPRALDARGRLKVGVSNFGFDVARNVYPGITFNNKFGRNTDTATGDAIWSVSTAFVEPATAAVVNFASTDAADTAAGTGARTLTITGINGSYDSVTETISLLGATVVPTANSYFYINRAFVATAGTGGTQAGTITGTSAAAGTPILCRLLIGYNQTQNSGYMVPRNYSAYLNLINVGTQNVLATALLDLGLFKKTFGGVYRIQAEWLLTGGSTNWQVTEFGSPLKWEAKSIVLFKCISASGGTWDVRVDYDIYLVADSAV